MNKKGVTILELLISITLTSIIVLLLIEVIISLNKVNNNENYASDDEIKRTEIIKNIESDFLKLKLNGLTINDNKILFIFEDNSTKELTINTNSLIYDNEKYVLETKNATYSTCFKYNYQDLDNNYYLITLDIPVIIKNKKDFKGDDISLTYLGLKKENTNYQLNYTC